MPGQAPSRAPAFRCPAKSKCLRGNASIHRVNVAWMSTCFAAFAVGRGQAANSHSGQGAVIGQDGSKLPLERHDAPNLYLRS